MAYLILFIALNILLSSYAEYIGKYPGEGDHRAVLRQGFELQCNYNGADGDGQFVEWYKDGVAISTEKQGHYVVKSTGTESKLIIKIFVPADGEVKKWHVKTAKTGEEDPAGCQFPQITIKSSPQGMETNRIHEKLDSPHGSIRRNEEEEVTLKCLIAPAQQDNSQKIEIEWTFSKDDNTFADLKNIEGLVQRSDKIEIARVKKMHRGYYRCTLNDVSFTVLLRVKDRLAALWPFIGIVCVVLVLVIIILIFEKRQKTTRKTVITDEDEHDHANDPLVRLSNKTSDNESKKRAIKT